MTRYKELIRQKLGQGTSPRDAFLEIYRAEAIQTEDDETSTHGGYHFRSRGSYLATRKELVAALVAVGNLGTRDVLDLGRRQGLGHYEQYDLCRELCRDWPNTPEAIAKVLLSDPDWPQHSDIEMLMRSCNYDRGRAVVTLTSLGITPKLAWFYEHDKERPGTLWEVFAKHCSYETAYRQLPQNRNHLWYHYVVKKLDGLGPDLASFERLLKFHRQQNHLKPPPPLEFHSPDTGVTAKQAAFFNSSLDDIEGVLCRMNYQTKRSGFLIAKELRGGIVVR